MVNYIQDIFCALNTGKAVGTNISHDGIIHYIQRALFGNPGKKDLRYGLYTPTGLKLFSPMSGTTSIQMNPYPGRGMDLAGLITFPDWVKQENLGESRFVFFCLGFDMVLKPGSEELLLLESVFREHLMDIKNTSRFFYVISGQKESFNQNIFEWVECPASFDQGGIIPAFQAAGETLTKKDENYPRLKQAVQGLSQSQINSAILRTKSEVDLGASDATVESVLSGINRFKKNLFSSAALEEITPNEIMPGGMNAFKRYLEEIESLREASDCPFNLSVPNSVGLFGLPGTGKSLFAKYLVKRWELPGYRLQIDKCKNEFLGRTESAFRNALDIISRIGECILFIDELEKVFPAKTNHSTEESLYGIMLNWLQEKPEGVFLIAASNDPFKVRPELIRKGRFNELFYVGLPSWHDRVEITQSHLNAMVKDPEQIQISQKEILEFAIRTDWFVGAEIEGIIRSAFIHAVQSGQRVICFDDLRYGLEQAAPPLAKIHQEQLAQLERWGRENRNVGEPITPITLEDLEGASDIVLNSFISGVLHVG